MKSAKLFKNGQSQAVRLPKDFRLPGGEVFVRRLGNAIVLLPKDDPWQTLRNSLGQFSDDYLESRDQPPVQERKRSIE